MTEAAAEWVGVGVLRPWLKNPRKNDENAKRVAASIIRFGFGAPIVARRENGELIAGHTRLKAALLLPARWKAATKKERASWHAEAVRLVERQDVPVRYMDLDEREAHLLALADNRLNELSPWDAEALKGIASEYELGDMALAGWTGEELSLGQSGGSSEEEGQTVEFQSFGEDIATEHQCPKCSYRWSGKSS